MSHNHQQIGRGYYPASNKGNALTLDPKIGQQVEQLSHNIELSKQSLAKQLSELKNTSSVEIRRNWYGTINRDSIEEGFETTYKDMSNGFRVCGNAISIVHENMSRILDFIKLLTMAETEIYSKLDDLAFEGTITRQAIGSIHKSV